jgi:molybdenum cofactor cytidylyltransferase
MSGIWAIILAAGESKRMGSPKMLLPIGERTIIEQTIDNVLNSMVGDIMVVLGAGHDKIRESIAECPVKYCINDDYKKGMLSSVKCGLNSLPPDIEAVLFYPGDQPLISPAVTDILITAFKSGMKGIIIPVHNRKRGHPLLVGSRYRNEIMGLDNGEGLKGLAQKFPEDVLEVEVGTPDILMDIDTQDDYLKLIKQK